MMMLYDLTFTTPVHFGLEGIGQERIDHTVHSDTLWGAILDKWLLLYDDDPAILCREPSFTVSSAFPLIDGTRFYPVPTGALSKVMNDVAQLETGAIPLELKDLKKIRYVAERLLFAILSGKEPLLADLTRDSVYPYPLEPKKRDGRSPLVRDRGTATARGRGPGERRGPGRDLFLQYRPVLQP